MATTYVVLAEASTFEHEVTGYLVVDEAVEAATAAQACRKTAEDMSESELDGGVTLIAVPLRNWTSGKHTLKAETQRRIRQA